MNIFEDIESEVRSYSRDFPAVFEYAKGAFLFDNCGNQYIDFFSAAGSMNYGHNNPTVNSALIEYLKKDGIINSLDKATTARNNFLRSFRDTILHPRHLDYKIQLTGPTGTNAVESALKLARKVKKRKDIIYFTNSFHGLTLGSLSVTGNEYYRDECYGALSNTYPAPFDGNLGTKINTIDYLSNFLQKKSNETDIPAAIITETIQGEGGINVASNEWLKKLDKLCKELDILLIVDDIQMGNGRTGDFFSFEESGIQPDMITISKSLAGGLPMAMLLFKPELDKWKIKEETGTFRGNNLAFVSATQLLTYWKNHRFSDSIKSKGELIRTELSKIVEKYKGKLDIELRGRGMVWGVDINTPNFSKNVARKSFQKHLIVETVGTGSNVIKILPPLVIEPEVLNQGIAILDESIAAILQQKTR